MNFKTKLLLSLLFIVGLILATNKLKAQQAFTLQQAVDYAYQHSSKMQNAVLDEKITQEKIKVFRGSGLPQVKTSADMKYFAIIPTTPVPAKFLNPLAPDGAIGAAKFGAKWNTSLGVNASWLAADASYFLALKAQKELGQLMQYSTQRSKIDVAEEVSKAYYTAVISDKKLGLLSANIARLEQLLNETKEYNKQGFVEKIDVDRLQLAYNNLKTESDKVKELVDLSKSLLKFQMSFPVDQSIILTDSISNNSIADASLNNTFNPDSRLEIRQLNKIIELTELQLKAREWAWMPNVVLIGSASTSHYSNDFDFYQWKLLGGKVNPYYPTALVGISIGATLFDGFQNKHEKEQLRLKIQQNQNDVLNLKNAFKLEMYNASVTLKNAVLSISSQQANLELAQEVVRVTKIKYQQGVGSNLEVLNAETSLKESQTNYLSALYDAYIAKVNYDKAMGTLVK